jgi:hypothetical protein
MDMYLDNSLNLQRAPPYGDTYLVWKFGEERERGELA